MAIGYCGWMASSGVILVALMQLQECPDGWIETDPANGNILVTYWEPENVNQRYHVEFVPPTKFQAEVTVDPVYEQGTGSPCDRFLTALSRTDRDFLVRSFEQPVAYPGDEIDLIKG